MMPGMIMLWYGSEAAIPSGWHLCDGSMGTPDLRSKFVIGASEGFPVGKTGGTMSHWHEFTGDGHSHDLVTGTEISYVAPDGDYAHATSSNPCSGTTEFKNSIPPYHALCYIMKL